MHFADLIITLDGLNTTFSQQAARQADQLMTFRNWLFGLYIVEFEQNGEDRAAYGQNLLAQVAQHFKQEGRKGFARNNLYVFRKFYLTYPAIFRTLSGKLQQSSVGDLLLEILVKPLPIDVEKDSLPSIDVGLLLDRMSFSHFIELTKVDNPLYRRFYEIEAVKNNWTVRELNRAITTLLAERTGLSTDKAAVISRVKDNQPNGLHDLIRNPYILEFLGLDEKPKYSENDLERAIIDNLQDFLLEMGRGFCFENRQKRISFDNRHYRIDLVFYHRVLKCHVLIDLKIGEFDHADAGQMNLYLNYYKANEMQPGDNPPVGIILCADKNDALVEYATSGLAHDLFVSKYLAELPDKAQLQAFIERESQQL